MDLTSITSILFSLATLTLLEVILGIDNLVFLSIITSNLPQEKQKNARRFGLILALVTRLLFLGGVFWLTKLINPLFALRGQTFSIRDLLLIGGGLFLLYKGTLQIHAETMPEEKLSVNRTASSQIGVILQIGILDIVFSFDSVFTAVGMVSQYWIMATAIIIAIICMIAASEPLSRFIQQRPTVKMLALSFILLIGTLLIADGFHYHVPREYVYFAISYAVFVEILNTWVHKSKKIT